MLAGTAALSWSLALAIAQEVQSKPVGETEPPPTTTQAASQPAAPGEPPATELSQDDIAARVGEVQASANLEEAAKAGVLEAYKQVLEQLAAADEAKTRAAEFERLRQEAPQRLEMAQGALLAAASQPATEPVIEVPADASLAQLEQFLAVAEAESQRAEAAVKERDTGADNRAARRRELPSLLVERRAQLDQLSAELESAPTPTDEVGRASRTLLRARIAALSEEIRAHEAELRSYDARSALLSAQRDLAAADAALAETRLRAWQEAVSERRRVEAEAAAEAARESRRKAVGANPVLRALLEKNADLAEEKTRIAEQIERATSAVAEVSQKLKSVRSEFDWLARRLEYVGHTEQIGLVLLRRRADLPELRALHRAARECDAEISTVQLRILEHDDERRALDDRGDGLRTALAQLDPLLADSLRREIEEQVREAYQQRRKYLSELLTDYRQCFGKLSDLSAAQHALMAEIRRYGEFIDANVLWIRSAPALAPDSVRRVGEALRYVAAPARRGELLRVIVSDGAANPLMYASAALLLVALLAWRRRLRARLHWAAEKVARPYSDSLWLTLEAALVTLLLAVPWPATVGFVGWRLLGALETTDLAHAVGVGLGRTATVYLTLESLRQLCRPRGLGAAHFQWSAHALTVLRRHLRWAMPVLLPLLFVVLATARVWQDDAAPATGLDVLGQLAGVLGSAVLTVFIYLVLRPTGGVADEIIRARPSSWLARLKYVWFPACIALSLLTLGLAARGYFYTAYALQRSLLLSVWVALGALLCYYILKRWLSVAHRRLALEQARKRLAAAKAEAKEATRGPGEPPPIAEEPEIDLPTLSDQTRKLLKTLVGLGLVVGVWWVWAGLLPALGFLSQYEIRGGAIRKVVPSGTPAPTTPVAAAEGDSPRVVEPSAPREARGTGGAVTLANVVIALVVVVLTFVLAKNLPGLLEIAILQRLPLEPAARYAITTVSRYAITIVGLVVAFGEIGIGWSKVQWLAAAITFGLGFGLQEIFANFVSGLILLLERPIRVGDTVTVGDVSGTVSRIRIRATTIVDWDRKELVVPNKEFITGRLVNWTLSDTVNRLVIPVGVAYGSDTALAREILADAARRHPQVLCDPPPAAHVVRFGVSTIDLELRVFLPNVDARWQVRNDLLEALVAGLTQAGIEIAFPQLDVHIRSAPPGAIAAVPALGDVTQTADPTRS